MGGALGCGFGKVDNVAEDIGSVHTLTGKSSNSIEPNRKSSWFSSHSASVEARTPRSNLIWQSSSFSERCKSEGVLRVFVSSTTEELKEERYQLVDEAILRLEQLCTDRGLALLPIDLRRDLSSDDPCSVSLLKASLQEIHTGAYLVSVLGPRYGWLHDLSSNLRGKVLQCASSEVPPRPGLSSLRDFSLHEIEASCFTHHLNGPPWSSKPEWSFFYMLGNEISTEEPGHVQQKHRAFRSALQGETITVRTVQSRHELCDAAYEDLSRAIQRDLPLPFFVNGGDFESRIHDAYAETRAAHYLPRPQYEQMLYAHLAGSPCGPLCVAGPPGIGKTALVVNWASNWRRRSTSHASAASDVLFTHYASSSGPNGHAAQFLRRLISELDCHLPCPEAFDPNPVPVDPDDFLQRFPTLLGSRAAGINGRITIILDALDQMDPLAEPSKLDREPYWWLPSSFPSNVVLIVTVGPGLAAQTCKQRSWATIRIDGLEAPEALALSLFEDAKKPAQPRVVEALREHEPAASPEFVTTAVQLLVRAADSDCGVAGTERAIFSSKNLQDLYSNILSLWEEQYGQTFVADCLGLIATSHTGLSSHEVAAVAKVSPLSWWHFFQSASPLFVCRSGAFDFRHESCKQVVLHRYCQDRHRLHACLAAYFASDKALRERRAQELPFHLGSMNDWHGQSESLLQMDVFLRLWCSNSSCLGRYAFMRYWAQVSANLTVLPSSPKRSKYRKDKDACHMNMYHPSRRTPEAPSSCFNHTKASLSLSPEPQDVGLTSQAPLVHTLAGHQDLDAGGDAGTKDTSSHSLPGHKDKDAALDAGGDAGTKEDTPAHSLPGHEDNHADRVAEKDAGSDTETGKGKEDRGKESEPVQAGGPTCGTPLRADRRLRTGPGAGVEVEVGVGAGGDTPTGLDVEERYVALVDAYEVESGCRLNGSGSTQAPAHPSSHSSRPSRLSSGGGTSASSDTSEHAHYGTHTGSLGALPGQCSGAQQEDGRCRGRTFVPSLQSPSSSLAPWEFAEMVGLLFHESCNYAGAVEMFERSLALAEIGPGSGSHGTHTTHDAKNRLEFSDPGTQPGHHSCHDGEHRPQLGHDVAHDGEHDTKPAHHSRHDGEQCARAGDDGTHDGGHDTKPGHHSGQDGEQVAHDSRHGTHPGHHRSPSRRRGNHKGGHGAHQGHHSAQPGSHGTHEERQGTQPGHHGTHDHGQGTQGSSHGTHEGGHGAQPVHHSTQPGSHGTHDHGQGTQASSHGTQPVHHSTQPGSNGTHDHGQGTQASSHGTHDHGQGTQASSHGTHEDGHGTQPHAPVTAIVRIIERMAASLAAKGQPIRAAGRLTRAVRLVERSQGRHSFDLAKLLYLQGSYLADGRHHDDARTILDRCIAIAHHALARSSEPFGSPSTRSPERSRPQSVSNLSQPSHQPSNHHKHSRYSPDSHLEPVQARSTAPSFPAAANPSPSASPCALPANPSSSSGTMGLLGSCTFGSPPLGSTPIGQDGYWSSGYTCSGGCTPCDVTSPSLASPRSDANSVVTPSSAVPLSEGSHLHPHLHMSANAHTHHHPHPVSGVRVMSPTPTQTPTSGKAYLHPAAFRRLFAASPTADGGDDTETGSTLLRPDAPTSGDVTPSSSTLSGPTDAGSDLSSVLNRIACIRPDCASARSLPSSTSEAGLALRVGVGVGVVTPAGRPQVAPADSGTSQDPSSKLLSSAHCPHCSALSTTGTARVPSPTVTSALLGRANLRLGGVLVATCRHEEALRRLQSGLRHLQRALGPDHPEVAEAYHVIATCESSLGHVTEAASNALRCLHVSERSLGTGLEAIGRHACHAASLLLRDGRHDEALPLFKRSFLIGQRWLGSDSAVVGSRLAHVARCHQLQGKFDTAREEFPEALAILERSIGVAHPSFARTKAYMDELPPPSACTASETSHLPGAPL